MTDQETVLDVVAESAALARLTAEQRIEWAAEVFGRDMVLLSSMQKTSSVLMHLAHQLDVDIEVLFVDTGCHFADTLKLRDEFIRRYGLNILTLYPTQTVEQQELEFGRKLYQRREDQRACCHLRKTAPLLEHMEQSRRRAMMLGLYREEGGKRSEITPLMRDQRFGGYSLHPIYDWTREAIEDYLRRNQVPTHPLHAQGYPSIGCQCCTTPVQAREDPRAGRWRHLSEGGERGPKHCGLVLIDGGGI